MTLFQVATETLFNDPNIGQMGKDNPPCVTLTFPTGERYRAVPMARSVSEFDQLSNVITQARTKSISVRLSEVPVRPPRDTVIEGYAQEWLVNSAELSDKETMWLLDLSVG